MNASGYYSAQNSWVQHFASLIKIAIDLTVLHSEHISVQSHVDYSILAEYNNNLSFIIKLLHDQEI